MSTAKDVRELPPWVYARSRAGRLPTVTCGRCRRYRLAAIEAWIAESERRP
jgi:hypothetical protein